ncbi:MAG: AAA family ATPase [Desulfobacteraceae bacterium]|jgi:lon-related putative ATP-dependent protease|nr:AAA family ATPase [Desulfobacteraceae bacterium]
MPKKYELKPSDLRYLFDPQVFKFKNTSTVRPLDEVIGQTRAVQAIEFGLNMDSPGYNIFVTGIEGTGKSTIVQEIVGQHAKALPPCCDWCMVNNFSDEFCPKSISVPTGQALKFKKQMGKFIEDLQNELPKAFSSESYQKKQSKLKESYADKQRTLFKKLDQSAADRQITIQKTQTGYQTIPLLDDKPMSQEAFQQLSEEQRAAIEENIRALQAETESTLREVNKINQTLRDQIENLMAEVTLFVVRNRLDILKNAYKDSKDILSYLDQVQEAIVDNVNEFIATDSKGSAPDLGRSSPAQSAFLRYQVNVLVDRKGQKGAPVIFETNPTYNNLFGYIEKRAVMGTLMTDFTMVQAGSLLRANGGYLLLDIEAVLKNSLVWEALKRALQNKYLHIEDMAAGMGFGTTSLRPEPIPLEVKVVLIGSYHLFQLLQNHDSKFNKIFKVRADFDHEVKRSEDTMQQYARFIARVCKEDNLLPLSPKGVAAIVAFGEKQVADKDKLSLRFGSIQAVLKEADYWARKKNTRVVSDKYVQKALKEHRFRYNLYEEKIQENYVDETILIDLDGAIVGQVNALAVHQIGDLAFGRPSRITAETYLGKEGIINIERESKLSGKTHDKGVLILSGYLGRTFAQKYPLNLSASITFEQSYGGIDGDSASSTELYAILSSLSGVPIYQGIAVTGSVNQKGQVQAIGGVNHKIEGFFDVCKAKGLTGSQGVMIPKANVKNLMLKREVIDAVKKGKFHIYRVATIPEGIEILTGAKAGAPDQKGNFPPASVYGKVQAKLKEYVKRTFELKKEFE